MFESFTDRARRVIVLAQEESRMLAHNYIGTEHILLGLIHEGDGIASKALESLGVSLDAVRQEVEEIIGRGQQAPTGHIPFTPRAKKVLELGLRESWRLDDAYVASEHLLLAIIREGEGVAAEVLTRLGVTLDEVRERVIRTRVANEPGTAKQEHLQGGFDLVLRYDEATWDKRIQELVSLERQVGAKHPDYLVAKARLLEGIARQLRKEAKATQS